MEMNGVRTVPAPVNRVWDALNDTEILKGCIPGCESLEAEGENAYKMVMAAKVGPVSARFTGKMRLTDVVVPNSYTLHFEGSGGVAGFVSGLANVSLAPDGANATTLTYAAKAQVGGKLAQVGSRLIEGAAQKITDESFTKFVELVRPAEVVAAAGEAAPASVPMAAASAVSAPAQGSMGRTVAIAGLAVVVAIVLYVMQRG